MDDTTDVAIIGAGPSGSIAAALLAQRGHRVEIIEQSYFPRFSIGESLLPQCMEFIEEAGMMEAVAAEGFQLKNGAIFNWGERFSHFDFSEKTAIGAGTTFQVQRSRFDQILAESAVAQGVDIRFGNRICGMQSLNKGNVALDVMDDSASIRKLRAKFVLDASGHGRVLARLLCLTKPSDFPVRRSLFTHIKDNIADRAYDRNKILITIHPQQKGVWFWLIPFSDGRCSLGVVAENDFFDQLDGSSNEEQLRQSVANCSELSVLLEGAVFDSEVQDVCGYASNVTTLFGENYALLGNAAEFLDPVFSSGVTIAMKSASLAAPLVSRQINGGEVDWAEEYAGRLKTGVNTFRAYVNSWYEGSLQNIIFTEARSSNVRNMICSILAGYAWDMGNPLVRQPERRLRAIAELCATL